MTLFRRNFLGGLAGLLAAPAIVRIASLMPVKACDQLAHWLQPVRPELHYPTGREIMARMSQAGRDLAFWTGAQWHPAQIRDLQGDQARADLTLNKMRPA